MSHLKNWDWKCGILHISPLLYVRAHDWLKNRKILNRCVFAPFILILPSSQSTVENIKLLNYHTVTHIVIHEKQHALLWGNTQLILFSPLIHKTSLSSSYIMWLKLIHEEAATGIFQSCISVFSPLLIPGK